jgi:hypothetical protein
MALVVLLVALLASCAGAQRVGDAGVTVALPRGWSSLSPHAVAGVTPHIVDPLTRVVVASGPIGFAPTDCQVAAYSFPRDGVAVIVVEWRRPNGAPYRPHRFTPRELPVLPPPALECWDGPGGATFFSDHRRTFGAYVLLGRNAPAGRADEARAVLDSLRVTTRAAARRRGS